MKDPLPDLPFEEHLQPPMANGEVVFEEPWQGRIFAMAILLHEKGLFSWPEFQAELIAVISVWDNTESSESNYQYYEHFSEALKNLLNKKDIVGSGEISDRFDEFRSRPHGHDH